MTNQETLNITLGKIKKYEETLQFELEKNEGESVDDIINVLKELYSHRRNLQRAIRSEKQGAKQPWRIKQERFNEVIELRLPD